MKKSAAILSAAIIALSPLSLGLNAPSSSVIAAVSEKSTIPLGMWKTADLSGNDILVFFNTADGDSPKDGTGIQVNMHTGQRLTFTYYVTDGDQIHFSFNDGNTSVYTLLFDENAPAESPEMTLTSEKGVIYNYIYGGMLFEDTVTFYTDIQLENMARRHYAEVTGTSPQYAASNEDHTNDTVNIQLYDIVDDHASTYSWYTINRFTGTGVDLIGEPIDISKYADKNIRKGIWRCNEYPEDFLSFDSDETLSSLSLSSFNLPKINYTIDYDTITISKGEKSIKGKIKASNAVDLELELTYEEKTLDLTFSYVSNKSAEDFMASIYSYEQLNELAETYFERETGKKSAGTIHEMSPDGFVSLNVTEAGENGPEVKATYLVSPFSAEGKDSNGELVDLKEANFGDITKDSRVDGRDASKILNIYADLSSIDGYNVDEDTYLRCDANTDNKIDGRDAAIVLSYYADMSSNADYVSFRKYSLPYRKSTR